MRSTSLLGVILVIFVLFHVVFAGSFIVNRLSTDAVVGSAENVHALFSYQYSAGLPLYGGADPEVQDLWYSPLAFQLMGTFMRIFTVDIRGVRFLTALFAIMAVVLVGKITHILTRSRLLAFVSAGLLLASPSSAWYIYVGPDAYLIFFSVLGLYLLIRDPQLSWRTVVCASLAFFCSFWAKQTGLGYLVAGLFYMLTQDWRKGVAGALISTALIVAGVLYYATRPDSSFIHNFFVLQGQHPILWHQLLNPVLYPEYLGRFGVAFGLIIAGLIHYEWKWSRIFRPELIFLGAAFVIGTITRCKYGSGVNQAIMLHAMLLICASYFGSRLVEAGKVSKSVLLVFLCIQCLSLIEDYRILFITKEDQARFNTIKSLVATPGKNVYYANSGFINVLAGKPAIAGAGRDCYVNGRIDRSRFPAKLRRYFESDPFDLVIIDVPLEDNSWMLYERLNTSYKPVQEIPPSSQWGGRGDTIRWKKIIFEKKDKRQ